MKYELTKEELEEIACCIVDNALDRDEACKYALSAAYECALCTSETVEVNES